MAAYEEKAFASELLKRYAKLSADDKTAVVQTLASRPSYAGRLTDAKFGVPRRDIPAYIVRQLRRSPGQALSMSGAKSIRSRGQEAAFMKYRTLLTGEAITKGNAVKAHLRAHLLRLPALRSRRRDRAGSHRLNRANLDYILENILNPSGDIPEGYQMILVTTSSGQTYAGTLPARTSSSLSCVWSACPGHLGQVEIQSRETIHLHDARGLDGHDEGRRGGGPYYYCAQPSRLAINNDHTWQTSPLQTNQVVTITKRYPSCEKRSHPSNAVHRWHHIESSLDRLSLSSEAPSGFRSTVNRVLVDG